MLDDLERALEAAEEHEEAKLEEGVRLVHRELADALAKEGLVEIETDGAFDPHVHEALLSQPSERTRARSSRCSRRATGSATACCGRRAWSSPQEAQPEASEGPLRDPRRPEERLRGRDQEGLPQARAPVPPGPEPGRRERGGALQGGPGRLRRALRSREAQAVRPARLAHVPAARPGGGFQWSGTSATSGDLGDLFGGLFGRGRGGTARAARRAAARRRRRGATVSLSFEDSLKGVETKIPVELEAACSTCRGSGARARHGADRSARSAAAAASRPRARASSRSRSRARAAAATAP